MIDRRALLVLLVLGLSAQAHAGEKGGTLPPWTSGTLTPAVIPVTSTPVTTAIVIPPPAIKTPAVLPDETTVKTPAPLPPDVGKTPAIVPLSPAAPSSADTNSAAIASDAAAAATAAAIAAANAAPAASDNSAAIAAAAAAEAAAAAAAASSTAIPSTSVATTGTGDGTKPPPITLPAPGQIPTQSPGQIPSQIPGQLPLPPSQFPGQLPTQLPGQLPTQLPGQLPPVTQFPGQLPTQFPGQIPSQFPGQLPPPVSKLPTTPTLLPLPTTPVKLPALGSSTTPTAAHTSAPVLPTLPATTGTGTGTVATDASTSMSAAPSTHFQGFAMSEKAYELVDMQVPTPAGNQRGQRGTITIGGDAFTLWNYRVAGPYVIKGQPSPYEAARSGDMAAWRGSRTNSDVRVWQVSADVYPATAPAWHRGGAYYPRKAGQLWVRIIQKVDSNVYIQAPGPQTGIMDGFVSFWSARYRLLTSGAFNAIAPAVAAPSTSPTEPNTEDLKKSY